jgi:nucleoside-diphosphate-sugar epimerase
MKVLVTGARGFIGQHLVRLLVERGHQVFACARKPKAKEQDCNYGGKVSWVYGDLLAQACYEQLPTEIDVVYHSAARLGGWRVDEREIRAANIHVVEKLLHWFSNSEGRQFIFFSTPGVQGFGHKLAGESDKFNPRAAYERSKVEAERVVSSHNYSDNQHWTILRPDFVYGPGDTRRLPLYRRIKKGFWVIAGTGESLIRPTYVLDVCEAALRCLQNENAYSQVFNIAGPDLVTAKEYAQTIAIACGCPLRAYRLPVGVFKILAVFFECLSLVSGRKPFLTRSQVEFLAEDHGTDIQKIANLIGFKPRVSLAQGMGETISWATKEGML